MKSTSFIFFFSIILVPFLLIPSVSATMAALLGAALALIMAILHAVNVMWVKPRALRWKLQRQGIKGPPPSFFSGNVKEMQAIQADARKKPADSGEFVAHDYTSTLFPYFEQWRKEYGLVYTYSTGDKQHLYVNQPELVKEMNQSLSLSFGKPSYVTKRLGPMLGNGILRSNGHLWAQQRKIIAPEFFMDKVKGMVKLMLHATEPLVAKWDAMIESQGGEVAEIKVDEDLRSASGDVIARACFGSSYFKGKAIFEKLRTLQKTIANQSILFGKSKFRFLPSKNQKEIQCLEKEIETLILETIAQRREDSAAEKDLLQLILEGAINDVGQASSKSFVVDNCKNIYFAGHESTAVAMSWCLMLLAQHPEWQHRIRDEIAEVCPNGLPDPDSLSKMKTVTMVIHEVMRLYPPAAFVSREALEEARIGDVTVPKGVCTWTLIPTLHRNPEIWGPDANEFKPERFANGISGACELPQVYIPFGLGPRLCLGKNFAMAQLKVVISQIVSRYSFSLSPKYRHCPAYRMIVEPGQGVYILIKRV